MEDLFGAQRTPKGTGGGKGRKVGVASNRTLLGNSSVGINRFTIPVNTFRGQAATVENIELVTAASRSMTKIRSSTDAASLDQRGPTGAL